MRTDSDETLIIPATDGYPLAASIFEPDGPVRSTVVIQSATAVPRRFYAEYAADLAARGRRAITFDYRGIGGSAPPRLGGFRAMMLDWADRDAAAVSDFAATTWNTVPLGLVGHSFGGQAYGLNPHPRVSHVLGIATQIGDMRLFPPKTAAGFRFLARVAGPLAIRLTGHFPANWFGLGEPMPGDVFRQWARWCLTPDYFFGDPAIGAGARFARAGAQVHLAAFDDDTFAPEAAVRGLARRFPSAKVEVVSAAGTEAGRIGHFGFFRKAVGGALWDRFDARLG
ncbi:MAG: alpha/beta fold hydrolase [Phreatobacter sp.]|uniref:alpha/beta hydrolase family protein n=1 Tax=Phreatobacter sp. TaxID=1966341 RepID=UPI001A4841B1|nr:alpha/beta hydrolase [Phreatobacter sp.]MBL8571010.1 alpha/beta fold hydrolase [Phreatobacter sp.]